MRFARVLCVVVFLSAAAFCAEKPRIFILESQSWEVSGGGGVGVNDVGAAGGVQGGARPQTAEIIKTFMQRCPAVTITGNRQKADYVVRLDHEGGKQLVMRDNKVVIYNSDDDVVYSNSTRTLGNAVKDACSAIAAQPHK